MSKASYAATVGALVLAVSALAVASGALGAASPTLSAVTTSGVTDSAATVSASVNANGQATTYAFEYGTSTHYTQQTAATSAGAGTQPVAVSEHLSGLRPGTTYHVRVLASNAGGTAAGSDATFTTAGIAPPSSSTAQATTGPLSAVAVDGATLTGTIDTASAPAGEPVHYYFQLGPGQPYSVQTITQTISAGKAATAVSAQVHGLESMQLFHYRLVAVTEDGQLSAGSDKTFTTLPKERLHPAKVQASATPGFQRRLPDRVTVTGRMVPPSSLSNFLACRGYFDVTFRVGKIAVQSLRAGIHKDCTFKLAVVFHSRRRLMGGHVQVHVLFAGNRFLHRLEAPPIAIQVG
jgi:hypothetical protein